MRSAKAVVIGSGPNGLAAAITLAEAGLEVEVHEAAPRPGGGLHTAELTLPGFTHDVCSAVFPLALASPFFRSLDLPVEWIHAPTPLAHPLDDGTTVVLERDVDATAAGLGADGDRYRTLVLPLAERWDAIRPLLLGPHPPPPAAIGALARALGPATLARSVRAALAAALPFAHATFRGERARALFAGNAAHALLPLERRPTAAFGLTLTILGHAVGWPVARGGALAVAEALVGRLEALGGSLQVSSPVDELPAADLVLADVAPRELLRIAGAKLPDRYARGLARYRHGPGAFKLDWALDGPVPWRASECRHAGTVHLGGGLEEIAASERASWRQCSVERPFVILSQPSLFDTTRAPSGRQTAWAYCHVANGSAADMTDRVEAQVERFAPDFRDRILMRRVTPPGALESANRNFVGGDISGGAMDLGQLFFRPTCRLVPYRTPVEGLYLCSASTPPGGGVHGMCGASAARLALRDLEARS